MNQEEKIEFGKRFAEVCESFSNACHQAGGAPGSVLSLTTEEIIYIMAQNGIRFIYLSSTKPVEED
jgi:hypothetical protein